MTSWRDLFEGRTRPGEEIELSGEFRGTLMEEIGKGVYFSIQPRDDFAPLVDGYPMVHVDLPLQLDSQTLYNMRFACSQNGAVKVFGVYHPKPEGEMLGTIRASAIEF